MLLLGELADAPLQLLVKPAEGQLVHN
ncbi:hypothetical protein NB231_02403 [Nitrococcus mobilis Nb-231]|uniref:Uncharacterized protein n=1 Tax=Nitrococcus mobilis Nb-231 TaxID=314278 RepID=A4BRL0_9GAMM|nr:hypothetical protein NB231_02403 [Nitrococcus mobilis Nb-231]